MHETQEGKKYKEFNYKYFPSKRVSKYMFQNKKIKAVNFND